MEPKPQRRLVVGNWKMHGLRRDLSELAGIGEAAAACPAVDVGIALPATLILPAADAAPALWIGAQDVHSRPSGAFTGEVSATMIRDAGGRFTLIGHSERRAAGQESNTTIKAKAEAARQEGLSAIVCVGEDAATRADGQAERAVSAQLLDSLPEGAAPSWLVIAYEPIWAIGTGRTPSTDEIADIHAALRRACVERLGDPSLTVRLLYGGSVSAANASEILRLPNVDGVLVGGASLRASGFTPIIRLAQNAAHLGPNNAQKDSAP
ncbi:triose-phosphate isomerase [Caulobacter sp. 602-1]|uniref:triose-phosphate isomerase n=1 Tax=Caulobacter sp. 602-1 TaxID=2492472 RepID=UPI000F63E90C|nr:triose-phosphate isomerase [Caulobacter sp. 602-1]RRN63892.1 triose-phosphate isomerase [Caulobacter sp. 602-1]